MNQLYFFDLRGVSRSRDHRGEVYACPEEAKRRGDIKAQELARIGPRLLGTDCYVAVLDASNREIYRAPLNGE